MLLVNLSAFRLAESFFEIIFEGIIWNPSYTIASYFELILYLHVSMIKFWGAITTINVTHKLHYEQTYEAQW